MGGESNFPVKNGFPTKPFRNHGIVGSSGSDMCFLSDVELIPWTVPSPKNSGYHIGLLCGWHIDDQGRECQQPSHHSNRSPHQRFPFAIFEVRGGGWLFCGWHRRDEGRQYEQPMSNGTRVDLQSWCRFQSNKKQM